MLFINIRLRKLNTFTLNNQQIFLKQYFKKFLSSLPSGNENTVKIRSNLVCRIKEKKNCKQ